MPLACRIPAGLKPVRKCDHPEMKEAAQSLRKLCKEEITRRYRCFRISSQEAIEEISAIAPAIRGAFALTRAFGERYRQEKRRRHILDFSDLEHEALRLLYGKQGGRPGAVAREISERYCEILVDEYQDSNAVQDAIFRAVSREGSNLFLVGDVKQSIYRFRLADPGIFLEKYKTYASYKVSAPGEPRKILLSENFRSQPEILQAVNDVFFRAMSERTGELRYGEAEALKAGLPFPEEQCCPVELHCIRQDVEGDENSRGPSTTEVEAAFLAWHIADLLRSGATVPEKGTVRPLRPEDIAILLRSPRSAAAEYIEALQKMGIPCFTDSGADLLETTELQVLSSLMEVVENPHQDIPLLSVLASPLFGFSADELSEIRGKNRKSDFCGALRSAGTDKAARFCTLLDHFRQVNATEGLIALLDCILDETDALTVFGAMKGGKSRAANVQVFRTLVIGRAESGEDLVSFVRTLRDLRETGLPMQDGESHGAVLLTSIHKSKGLEYPVVYLAGLSKSFNLQDLNGSVLIHPSLGVASDVVDPVRRVRYPSAAKRALAQQLRKEAVSEELRVLYVAMTRAKSRLILSYCADYLDNRLKKLVLLRTFASEEQAAAQVSCEGDWVLLEALGRTEAGVLHAVAAARQRRQSQIIRGK